MEALAAALIGYAIGCVATALLHRKARARDRADIKAIRDYELITGRAVENHLEWHFRIRRNHKRKWAGR